MITDLYNSRGELIAYEKGGEVFKKSGEKIGYVRGIEVFDNMGNYFGTLTGEDRIFKFAGKGHMKAGISAATTGSVRGMRTTHPVELPHGAIDIIVK